jgi:TPR repeat protein
MKQLRKQSVLIALFQSALLAALAQTPAIDPALLAEANGGNAASEITVGESYAGAKDLKQAAEWYRRAADQGSIPAELRLATLYRDGGKGFLRDMAQAAGWYAKAAEQGDVTAQAAIGVLYSIGQGVPRNDVEAYYWLGMAASVKGANQPQYAANRQIVGARITTDEQADVEERVAKWIAAHPRPVTPK